VTDWLQWWVFDNPAAVIIGVGALVGVACSLLGVFLVLRKTSMLSDAISHSVLLGIVVSFFVVAGDIHSPLLMLGATLAGVLTVVLTEVLTASRLVKEDAAIGLVFPALFALAVLLINLFAENVHLDVHAVMLGAIELSFIDAYEIGALLVPKSLLTMSVIALINALFVGLAFKELKIATFDAALASALGFSPALIHYALLTLTSVTAVGAMDAVGPILVVAFIVVPPSTAYLVSDNLKRMIAISIAIAVASAFLGYYSAMALRVSIGGMMALATGVFLALAFLFGPRYGFVAQQLRWRRQRLEYAEQLLLVHLYNHELTGPADESLPEALESHLRWRERQSRRVVERAIERGHLVARGEEDVLQLTEKGRERAQKTLAEIPASAAPTARAATHAQSF
jgi:manganese/zinc/iron transport system permease protein